MSPTTNVGQMWQVPRDERLIYVVRQIKAVALGPLQDEIANAQASLLGIKVDRYTGMSDVVVTSNRVVLVPAPAGPTGLGMNVVLAGASMGGALGGAIAGLGSGLADALGSRQARPVGVDQIVAEEARVLPQWHIGDSRLTVKETRRSLFPPDYAILFKISGPCHFREKMEQMELMFAIQGRVTKSTFGNARPEAYGPISKLFGFSDSDVTIG